MRSLTAFVVFSSLAMAAAGSAIAQNEPLPNRQDTVDQGEKALPNINRSTVPSNPAIKTTPQNNAGAPVPGANSFTEAQAKSRIEARGYSSVSDLTMDTQGIWHGHAQKDGKQVQISLDYQGNVVVN